MSDTGSGGPLKRMVIVGNGPLSRDFSAEVDAADFVIRFNEPKAGIGLSGARTDRLFMANSGKPMERRLNDPSLLDQPIFRAAREIILAYHPQIIARHFRKPNLLSRLKGRRADWTLPAILRFGAAGKEVRVMPPAFYLQGCVELGLPENKMRRVFPSTGYFGIFYALERFPPSQWRIELCGFTWAGWQKHAWADERRWVAGHVKAGRLVMLDSDMK